LFALVTPVALVAPAFADDAAGKLVLKPAESPKTPAELYGPLFEQVQLQRVYPDGKTFVDALPRGSPEGIREAFQAERKKPGFDLTEFVKLHFVAPGEGSEAPAATTPGEAAATPGEAAATPGEATATPSADRSESDSQVADRTADEAAAPATGSPREPPRDPREAARAHIDALWPQLTREPDTADPHSSLIPLPYAYVVPGGRFREVYYWDSYFTMLGLEESDRHDLTRSMLDNFAHLIDAHGHVPNGNRSYYLSRSQPPFFAAMVELAAERDGDEAYRKYLPSLEREYAFWMDGAQLVGRNAAVRRVVRLDDGSVLNRYWDDRATPREESYREDVATARAARRPAAEVYRNLRAAAESGWDFSSRWLTDGRRLETIRTVDIVPVDLNSLLYRLEQTLATAYRVAGQADQARSMGAKSWSRRQAMHRYLWNEDAGAFGDYDWRQQRLTSHLTAATLYPLYFGLASQDQAGRVATFVRQRLLQPDGVATTTAKTGQQWDAPNGWAPLQWLAIKGLRDTGEPRLARDIACRWIDENVEAYAASGKLVEKYDVSGDGPAGGGEYPTQDGFGWTNGVLRKLMVLYPAADCPRPS